jgi:valyl-tRNA synthetase
MSELPKTFDPTKIEERWYAHWESRGLFRPERPDADPWTIVNPPPNVTGALHIGHAIDNTLQDICVRHARMTGKDALWVVGTDHAGIATQMVVERNLASQGLDRAAMGRDAFLEHVWEWKAQSGGQITRQLRRLGCSMDWSNERFTMDEGMTRAVYRVFVQLYREGLLYRDKRLVNWDPRFQSAISDLEVETREVQGKFWHLKYPLADGSGAIHVATTRPETMLADMAVAVHPDDDRYRDLVGKQVKLPITGRLISIITDEHADPELGSGAVKITPGHDFNDFEVGKRAGIKPADMLNMLDAQGRVVQTSDGLIPPELAGLDRFDARKRVVELLEAEGALDKVEDRVIATPYGDRSGVVIEPWLTDQWYIDAATLAKPAIAAVREGRIEIVPKSWEKTWFNWLENIQPWCVSRQLWWGHRIPAWYADDGEVFVAETEEEAQLLAGGRALRRDEDVLDTWFSSALWPFATLGWPDETETLNRHYPNDLLISGFDIIFFWDARMAMQGIHFMGDVPWKRLYLHGLVRDAHGQKMSKSKGNTVDPLGLIDKYGADALRFTLAAMESQGRDIKLDEKRVEGYRNFATKLWNAARFLQMNGVGASDSIAAPTAELPVNRWIIGEVVETLAKLNRAFNELRYDEMADAIYHFVWGTFCDWYVELVKGAFDEETKRVAAWAFDQILVMLHPLMPFITEELWSANERPYELIVAKWPDPQAEIDQAAKERIDALIGIISGIRTQRLETGFKPADVIPISPVTASHKQLQVLNDYQDTIRRMARVRPARIEISPYDGGAVWSIEKVEQYDVTDADQTSFITAQFVLADLILLASTRGFIDVDAERVRLSQGAAAAEKERDSLAQRLSNPNFTERAKPEAVEKARADHEAKAAEAERLRAALERLG